MVGSLNGTLHVHSFQQLSIGVSNARGIGHRFLHSHLGILPLAVVHLLKDDIGPQISWNTSADVFMNTGHFTSFIIIPHCQSLDEK